MPQPPRTDRRMMHFYEQAPIDVVLDRLRQRAALDKLAEARRAKWQKRALFAGLGGTALFVLFVILLENEVLPEPLTAPLFLATVGVTALGVVVCLVQRARVGRADVEDRKYELAQGVLEPLAPEIRPGRDCVVAIDFSGYAERPAKAKAKPSLFSPVTNEEYEQTWLELEIPLRDGTLAVLEGSVSCKRKKKRKRKYTKVTDKLREKLQVTLQAPKGEQLAQEHAESWARRLGQVPGLEPAGLRVSESRVQLRYRTGEGRVVRGRGASSSLDALLAPSMVIRALVAGHRAVRGGLERV